MDKPIHNDPWNRAIFYLRKNGCCENESFVVPNSAETQRIHTLLKQCNTAANNRPKRDLENYLNSIGVD